MENGETSTRKITHYKEAVRILSLFDFSEEDQRQQGFRLGIVVENNAFADQIIEHYCIIVKTCKKVYYSDLERLANKGLPIYTAVKEVLRIKTFDQLRKYFRENTVDASVIIDAFAMMSNWILNPPNKKKNDTKSDSNDVQPVGAVEL